MPARRQKEVNIQDFVHYSGQLAEFNLDHLQLKIQYKWLHV